MKKALCIFIFLLCSGTYYAQIINNDPSGFHKHDGFYLSLSTGAVYADIRDEVKRPFNITFDISGIGATFDFKIGGAVSENIILFGNIISSSIQGPKISVLNDTTIKAPSDFGIGESHLGGGVAYYFQKNFFASLSLGLGNFSFVNLEENKSSATERGLGLQLKLGKEWWVSKNWAFGVSVTYSSVSVDNKPEPGIEEYVNSNMFSIMFNTTFN